MVAEMSLCASGFFTGEIFGQNFGWDLWENQRENAPAGWRNSSTEFSRLKWMSL